MSLRRQREAEQSNSIIPEFESGKEYYRHEFLVRRNGSIYSLRSSVDLPYSNVSFTTNDWEQISGGAVAGNIDGGGFDTVHSPTQNVDGGIF